MYGYILSNALACYAQLGLDFTGSEDERGLGDGEGYNINFPLPRKTTGDQEYCETLRKAIQKIIEFKPKFMIVR